MSHDGTKPSKDEMLGWLRMIEAGDVAPTPLCPTPEMIEAGAQRLVRWEDGSKWPESWSALDVAASRNDAERVWRSMWIEAAKRSSR